MLRILLDEGISRAVAREQQASGYAVEHALDLNLKGQPDPIIFIRRSSARRWSARLIAPTICCWRPRGLPGD